MKKLFTKRFFAASPIDQRTIVDSRLADLKQALSCDGMGRVKAMIRRIEKKAVKYGIYTKEGGDD